MRTILKTVLIAGTLLTLGIANAQQSQVQPSVKRHPGEHISYTVTLADGDISKITGVSVHLVTNAPELPNQPGAQPQFGGQCKKSADPKIWNCDVLIPDGIRDGDYKLSQVSLGTPNLGRSYTEDFHVPMVPIQNPSTFTPPSKVTVTEQP
jgi:hypothetical protein